MVQVVVASHRVDEDAQSFAVQHEEGQQARQFVVRAFDPQPTAALRARIVVDGDEEFAACCDRQRRVCERAPQNASIVSEVPGVVRYYTQKFGRGDLQSHVLSDPNYTPSTDAPTYVILQTGRTYLENQQEMKQVKERFTLVYAGCIKGHTAAEVYASPSDSSVTVQPCGDARP